MCVESLVLQTFGKMQPTESAAIAGCGNSWRHSHKPTGSTARGAQNSAKLKIMINKQTTTEPSQTYSWNNSYLYCKPRCCYSEASQLKNLIQQYWEQTKQ